MLKDIFREYDIRGIVGDELNQISIKAIGKELGAVMKERGVKNVSVGYDARLSAPELFDYLLSGLNANDLDIFDIGLLATPVGYYSVFSGVFDANIMITGSHNPKEYNGFKITIGTDSFFGDDITKLGQRVCALVDSKEQIPNNTKCQKYDILSKYVDFFTQCFAHLKGFDLPFVCDCANGAAGVSLEAIIKALDLNAHILYPKPDGNFPNHHPDPSVAENLQDLKMALNSGKFALGFGFDGDGDRIAVLSKKRLIKGDELAYLYALNMKNPRVLGEVKCSQNMYDQIDKIGKTFMGKTGHSNIKKAMKELSIDMAAEVSGHIFFKERFFGFDDAVYAAMRVLELCAKGVDLDAKLDQLPKLYSTDEIKINSSDKNKFIIVEEIKNALNTADLPQILNVIDIDGVRVRFKDGWALVRASNTTPVLVTRFEANSQENLSLIQEKFTALINKISSNFKDNNE